eukprot:7313092-Pyramimonas_sp.AAC.1
MERSAMIPSQIAIAIFALIAKPSSGFRPIAMSCGFFQDARQASPTPRCHFCAGPLEGAQDAVWRRALRAEGSAAKGGEGRMHSSPICIHIMKPRVARCWTCGCIAMCPRNRFLSVGGVVDG